MSYKLQEALIKSNLVSTAERLRNLAQGCRVARLPGGSKEERGSTPTGLRFTVPSLRFHTLIVEVPYPHR